MLVKVTRFAVVTAAAALLASAQHSSGERHHQHALLEQLLHFDWLHEGPPAAGERCVQFSSFDRRSAAGPDDRAAWYANDDRGNYLRMVERDGRQEHVLVDVDGPGVLARLWSANPSGELVFDIDGQRVWTVDFARLCAGRIDGVPAPLAGMTARGGNVYLPIPFEKHLTIAATASDLYYHADVRLVPEHTFTASFDPALLGEADDLIARIAEAARGVDPDLFAPADGEHRHRIEFAAGESCDELYVRCLRTDEGVDLGEVLQRVRLVATVGDERTLDVPLPDFFASRDWRPWRSLMLGVLPDGFAYCRYAMPMPAGGSVELVVDGELPGVSLWIGAAARRPVAADSLLFRASYHQAKAQPTRPFSDHLVLDARGAGRFVGCSLLVRNPTRIWWGEGDEKVWVDGEAFPSWFGTGTEDYFGYAWCDTTPFEALCHAQTRCDGPMNYGFTQLHRSHLLDSIPFRESLRFEFERWHWVEHAEVDYATVAYWYGAPGAKALLPAMPPTARRLLERLPEPQMFVAENALEGEALKVLRCTGGRHEVQNLSIFDGRFSRDAQRWWRDAGVGDVLELEVPVPETGRYLLRVAMARASDFGIVTFALDGKLFEGRFDGFSPSVAATGPLVVGECELEKGTATLRLELVGHNPKAAPRHMVGLDYLLLERL